MYHIKLQSSGASFTATASEFLNGVPLPLTDVTFEEGAMYFTTGGRKLESGFTEFTNNNDQKRKRNSIKKSVIRRLLDTFHDTSLVADYNLIWENIGNKDRYIAYSARIALENHGVNNWASYINLKLS